MGLCELIAHMTSSKRMLHMLPALLPCTLCLDQRKPACFLRTGMCRMLPPRAVCRRTALSNGKTSVMRSELSDMRPPTVGVQLLVAASKAAVVGDAAIASKALLSSTCIGKAMNQPATEPYAMPVPCCVVREQVCADALINLRSRKPERMPVC